MGVEHLYLVVMSGGQTQLFEVYNADIDPISDSKILFKGFDKYENQIVSGFVCQGAVFTSTVDPRI